MAAGRKKTAKQQQEAQEVGAFIEALVQWAGFTVDADLARRAEVHASSLSDWRRGENVPGGYNLLRLIRASQEAAEERGASEAGPFLLGAARSPLRELAERVEEQGEATAKSVDALAREVRRLARRIAPADGEASQGEG